jgi:hypothetical protein
MGYMLQNGYKMATKWLQMPEKTQEPPLQWWL